MYHWVVKVSKTELPEIIFCETYNDAVEEAAIYRQHGFEAEVKELEKPCY